MLSLALLQPTPAPVRIHKSQVDCEAFAVLPLMLSGMSDPVAVHINTPAQARELARAFTELADVLAKAQAAQEQEDAA